MPFADRFVTVAGREAAYVDEGPKAGTPLVLLHGGGFDHAEMTWRSTIAALRGRYRVIVPDLPGYGASAGFGRPHDLTDLGLWLDRFLDAVGVARADVAGVSMGGGMALWLAIHRPARVRRLVPASAYGLMAHLPAEGLARLFLRQGGARLVYAIAARGGPLARAGLAATYADPARVTDAAFRDLVAVARDQSARRSFDDFLAAELGADGLKSDLTPMLGRIVAPTLLIHGAADRLIPPRHARRAARLVPGARLLELDAGHWPMRERPDLFLPALDGFLTDQPVTTNP
ncbi:alpha/beta hydrolase fold protein [Oceaniovalibus guishaninsula JLT2003]|uniref:Alpha/beta hydrolase fold protein n=1 Tax=Oceaniovalibus guishaninsula JLT2003 TaxID=1231392 RepID=K2HL01_9RHOB|nr:alpha/beta fold hydrolase [Oceaniovalibus guishaninsula]EKE43579.1 alpha/beta hydrolase fold protein [Oceaniovalibus guishaninsula JLT2003]